jgi:hypothetical protein
VVAGDCNGSHPRWTGKTGVRGSWTEILDLLKYGVLANSVGVLTFQRQLKSGRIQETTIDLTISSGVMIWEVDNMWATGAQQRTIVWQAEPGVAEEVKEPVRKYWKVRRPRFIKTKKGTVDESKEWKEVWRRTSENKRLGERVEEWADKIWEKEEFHPRAKRWWMKELTEAWKEYGRGEKTVKNRKKWIRKVREAKTKMWEEFIQEADHKTCW